MKERTKSTAYASILALYREKVTFYKDTKISIVHAPTVGEKNLDHADSQRNVRVSRNSGIHARSQAKRIRLINGLYRTELSCFIYRMLVVNGLES